MQKNLGFTGHKPAGFFLDVGSVSGDLSADLLLLGFSNEIMRNVTPCLSEVALGFLLAWGGRSLMSLVCTPECVHSI